MTSPIITSAPMTVSRVKRLERLSWSGVMYGDTGRFFLGGARMQMAAGHLLMDAVLRAVTLALYAEMSLRVENSQNNNGTDQCNGASLSYYVML